MTIYKYGNPKASIVLVQLVGDHDLPEIEGEVEQIRMLTAPEFQMIAVKVDDWNRELSPWRAPAVFGNEDFGEGASELLQHILELCTDEGKTYYLGGYSLAGLFSLWASYQTDRFAGIAAASPSVWFPGFLPYMKEHENQSRTVYLSLGDKEEKTRNAVMATVGDCIREANVWLQQCGIRSTLEWNPGNHFRDPGMRTAKAFAWVMKKGTFMIEERRSIRKFKSAPVDREQIEIIVRAAALAPSAKNRQPWKYIVYTGGEKDKLLDVMEKALEKEQAEHKLLPQSAFGLPDAFHTLRIMREAPVTIIVMNTNGQSPYEVIATDRRVAEICDSLSIGASIENMLLKATELGLGTLWIANTCFAYDDLVEAIGEPGQLIGAVTVGHPAEHPQPRPRKPLEEILEYR